MVDSAALLAWGGNGSLTYCCAAVVPDLALATAVSTLAILTATLAPPALIAAHRDPVRILRVP